MIYRVSVLLLQSSSASLERAEQSLARRGGPHLPASFRCFYQAESDTQESLGVKYEVQNEKQRRRRAPKPKGGAGERDINHSKDLQIMHGRYQVTRRLARARSFRKIKPPRGVVLVLVQWHESREA